MGKTDFLNSLPWEIIKEELNVFLNPVIKKKGNEIFGLMKGSTNSALIEQDIKNSKQLEKDYLQLNEYYKELDSLNSKSKKTQADLDKINSLGNQIVNQKTKIKTLLQKDTTGAYTIITYAKSQIEDMFKFWGNKIPKIIESINGQLLQVLNGIPEKSVDNTTSTNNLFDTTPTKNDDDNEIQTKHTGGVIVAHKGLYIDDLLPNERIIKALVGERILSIEQNKAFEKMILEGWGGGQDTHITNNYTYPVDMDSFREALSRPENGEIIKAHNAYNAKHTGRVV